MLLIEISLAVAAFYSACIWLFLAVHAVRTGINVELETFHLGLCFVLSIGFLGTILARGG